MAIGWKNEYLRYKGVFLNVFSVYYAKPDVKIFIEMGLSLVTISFFTVFALRPTFVTIAQIYKDIKSKEETVTKMDEKINNLQKAQQILSQKSDEVSLIESAVPTNPSPDKFVIQLQQLSNSRSISLDALSLTDVIIAGKHPSQSGSADLQPFPPGAQEMPVVLRIGGVFSSISQALADLENLRRPLKIDKVTINLSALKPDEISVALYGRTPYLKSE
ncbi:hypothetical protein HY045_02370 [Candidatus Woesebacteria bacterium]|nr:hypothetical protein [Candidatus Woesebacteria bacterium]